MKWIDYLGVDEKILVIERVPPFIPLYASHSVILDQFYQFQ